MFRGQVERKTSNLKQFLVYSDRSVVVAINPECIHIFKDSSPRVSFHTYMYTHIFHSPTHSYQKTITKPLLVRHYDSSVN